MSPKAYTALLILLPWCSNAQTVIDSSIVRSASSGDTGIHATLSETVVTGVPVPIKLQNALSQYRVITKAAMQAQGAVTVADALATQLNINLGNDRVLGSNISMQGLGGDKVKVLIDGLPVNGRENGNIDLNQIGLANVARIEIVQGPMSVVYGSDALGGVINIITSKATKPLEVSAGFNYEDVGKYNVDIAAAAKVGKRHSIQGGAGRNFFKGWGAGDTSTPQRIMTFKPKEQYLANLAYRYTAPSDFSLTAASDFIQEKVSNRGPVVGWPYTATAEDEYYHTTRSNNRLLLSGKKGTGLWRLDNGYAYYKRIRESLIKDLVTLQESPSTVQGSQDTSRFDDITLRSNYANTARRLHYDGGWDILLQRGQSGKFNNGEEHRTNNYALYANASMAFLKDKLTAQLGLRGTYNNVYDVPLIYSLNLLYQPGGQIQLRASYAKGFRAPSLKEQYLEFIDQNHHVIGNPDLKPEQGHHVQASASYQYTAGQVHAGITATGYYNEVKNEISLANPDPVPGSINRIYANIAHQRNAVFTIQTEQEWKSLYMQVGGGLTHTFAADSGYDAFNTLEATATARYTLKPAKLALTVFYKYTGTTRQLSALPDGQALYDSELPSYSLLDASMGRRFFNGRIDITAGVKNILDVRTIAPTGGISTGAHGSNGSDFLPRRVFATLRVAL